MGQSVVKPTRLNEVQPGPAKLKVSLGKDFLIVIGILALSSILILSMFAFTSRLYDYKISYLADKVALLEAELATSKNSSTPIVDDLSRLQMVRNFWEINENDAQIIHMIEDFELNNSNYFPIYYFKSGLCDKKCEDQMFVLDYIRLKHKNKVLIVEFNPKLNSSFIQNKISKYKIEKIPALVLNGEKFYGFVPIEVFEKRIEDFFASKFAIVVINDMQAEENKKTIFYLFDKFTSADIPVTLSIIPKAMFNFCDDYELYSEINSLTDVETAQQSSLEGLQKGKSELDKCLKNTPKTFVDFNTITPDTLSTAFSLNFENIITINDYYNNKRDAFGIFHVAATTAFDSNATKVAENCALFANETNLCVIRIPISDLVVNETTNTNYIDSLTDSLAKLKSEDMHFVTASQYKNIKEARKWA